MKIHKIIENGIEYDVIEHNTCKTWHYKDNFHRENGPAVEFLDGRKEYWLNDKHYKNIISDDEWIIFNIIT